MLSSGNQAERSLTLRSTKCLNIIYKTTYNNMNNNMYSIFHKVDVNKFFKHKY